MPYYIAEIYAVKKNYDKAQIVAQNYLSAYPQNEHAAEMYRILGDAYYHFGDYHKAVASFLELLEKENTPQKRRTLYAGTVLLSDRRIFQSCRNTRRGHYRER